MSAFMMAAKCEGDLVCPLCHGVFNNPTTLQCKHSFCKSCIQSHWKAKGLRQCPVCNRAENSTRPPSINLALKKPSDDLRKKKEHTVVISEDRCSLHNKEKLFFCRKDAGFICVDCTSSRSHANHNYCLITEAASDILKELTARYNPFKKHLISYEKLKENLEELEAYIQKQEVETAQQIKKEYEKLHEFLREEEIVRLKVLQNESKSKIEAVSERLEEAHKIIEDLTDIINYIDPIVTADDLSFFKECKEAIKRTQYIVPEAEYPEGSLINVSQYLGSIKHGVWKRMERAVSHCLVNFDPNTAHPNLIISDELTTIKYGKKQQVPDNPERCTSRMAVLAAGSFKSGKHSWHVEVGDTREWYIGVARESFRRKTSAFFSPTDGFWVIGLCDKEYWAHTSPRTRLDLKRKPDMVTVELDYEKGKVSFCNTANGSSIYTFKNKFTEQMFPYFCIGINEGSTLQICAL
nr:zinc-binding protein A33-like [Misgurnus anguillicaudatus]